MKAINYKDIGVRIKKCRESLGLTQEQLCDRLNISKQHLSNIECGKNGMSLEILSFICQDLNISSDYILFGSVKDIQMTPTLNRVLSLPEKKRDAVETSINTILDIIDNSSK